MTLGIIGLSCLSQTSYTVGLPFGESGVPGNGITAFEIFAAKGRQALQGAKNTSIVVGGYLADKARATQPGHVACVGLAASTLATSCACAVALDSKAFMLPLLAVGAKIGQSCYKGYTYQKEADQRSLAVRDSDSKIPLAHISVFEKQANTYAQPMTPQQLVNEFQNHGAALRLKLCGLLKLRQDASQDVVVRQALEKTQDHLKGRISGLETYTDFKWQLEQELKNNNLLEQKLDLLKHTDVLTTDDAFNRIDAVKQRLLRRGFFNNFFSIMWKKRPMLGYGVTYPSSYSSFSYNGATSLFARLFEQLARLTVITSISERNAPARR